VTVGNVRNEITIRDNMYRIRTSTEVKKYSDSHNLVY